MTCEHGPCTCQTEDGFCSDHCREAVAAGGHEGAQVCGCGHDGCS